MGINLLIIKLIMKFTFNSPTAILQLILIILVICVKTKDAKADNIEGPVIGIDLGTT